MRIIDISWPISQNMTQYKDRQSVFIGKTHSLQYHGAAQSTVVLDSHTGTHLDAPCHFVQGGATLDQVSLQTYVGPCQVVDVTDIDGHITDQVLKDINIEPNIIVLFKTKNSAKVATDLFDPNFVCIKESAARYLVEKKVKAVGLDYPGLEHGQSNHQTHLLFLENDIGIIEGLRLIHVQPKKYFLCCLPLAFQGVDGSPARAVLLEGV